MLINIKHIPIIKNNIELFNLLYLNELGSNSYIDIFIIIPAITEKRHPIVTSLINGFKNKLVITAPKSSDKPEIKVYKRAFFLLFVA